MMLKNIISFSIILLFLSACSEQEDNDYFPSKEGMQWRYTVLEKTENDVQAQKYIIVALAEKEIDGQKYSVRKSEDGTLFFYQNTEEGMIYTGKEIQSGLYREYLPENEVIFRYPLKIGEKWEEISFPRLLKKDGAPYETNLTIAAAVPISASIEDMNATISVPAGIFHQCIKILRQGSLFWGAGDYIESTVIRVKEESWYAPGVGLVKSVRQETTDSEALESGELIVELEKLNQ